MINAQLITSVWQVEDRNKETAEEDVKIKPKEMTTTTTTTTFANLLLLAWPALLSSFVAVSA